MTKISKLEELNLQKEAKELRDAGNGWIKVTSILNNRHPEIQETYDEPISFMGVKRGVIAYEQQLMEKKIEDGIDPIEGMEREFRDAIRKNNKKINKLIKTADKILEDAIKEGTISDKTRALKEVRDSLAQEVKNWIALQQYGIRQVGNIGSINLRKEQELHIHLDRWTDKLIAHKKDFCRGCQKIIDNLINDLFKVK